MVLLFFLWAVTAHAAITFPPLTGRVVDDAHVLSASTVQSLTDELAGFEQQTGTQLVIVTLPDLQGQEIEDYGYQLGRAWGIGQKGTNNGTLLIVAPKEHKTRIEVGYGLEGKLTDAMSSTIVNGVMLPSFRTGDYNKGVTDGAHAIESALGGTDENDASPPAGTPRQSTQKAGLPPMAMLILFLLVYFIFFRRRQRSSFLAPLAFSTLMSRSGGFGGGGFGGGGFSGGGGSFGGGGASGSW